jgi:hypothetical protein
MGENWQYRQNNNVHDLIIVLHSHHYTEYVLLINTL